MSIHRSNAQHMVQVSGKKILPEVVFFLNEKTSGKVLG